MIDNPPSCLPLLPARSFFFQHGELWPLCTCTAANLHLAEHATRVYWVCATQARIQNAALCGVCQCQQAPIDVTQWLRTPVSHAPFCNACSSPCAVIHDWRDEPATAILKTIRRAARPTSCLLIAGKRLQRHYADESCCLIAWLGAVTKRHILSCDLFCFPADPVMPEQQPVGPDLAALDLQVWS